MKMILKIALFFAIVFGFPAMAMGQQYVQNISGVVAVPVSTGSSFKLILGANVTSFSFNGPPTSPGQIVTMYFLQDATGSRTVTFASNIYNSCTITSTAATATVCQFAYDQFSNSWFGIGASGGGGGFTAGGDLSGTSSSQEVIGILSHTLPSLTTGFLNWTGTTWSFSSVSCPTCVTSAASLTSGQVMLGQGLQASATDTNLDDGITTANTLTYKGTAGITASAGPVTSGSDGVHAGAVFFPGNTTVPVSLPTNSFGLIGPNSASFTSYFLQPSATAPSGGQVLSCATPSSNVSSCTWVSASGGLGDPGSNGIVFRSAFNTTVPATRTNIDAVTYAAGGGTANAQTVTLSPAVTSLTAGLKVCWLPTAANSSNTVTLAINGLTAENIVSPNNGATIGVGDLITTRIACAIYDGTNFELQNRQTPFFTGAMSVTGGFEFDTTNSTYTNALGFGNTANQAINGGPSANSMLRGQITITNPATTGVYTFPLSSGGQAYTNAPVCVVAADTTSAIFTVTGAPWVDSAATTNLQLQVDVAVTPVASIKVNYVCMGFPN